jgi:hypothetical protein
VTTGNSRARLPPLGLGADMPVTVPRGNADGRASGPIRAAAPAEPLPLWPGGAGARCDGEGDGDWDLLGEGDGDGLGQGALFGDDAAGPGDGDGLGHADLLGEGDGLGEPDVLGDGEGDGDLDGLGEGELLGDGEGDGGLLGDGLGEGALLGDGEGDGAALDVPGEGDGDVLAAAPVLGRTASSIPAAITPPPATARTPAHGRAGVRFLCGLRALLRVRASEVITAAWTHARPQRFQNGPGESMAGVRGAPRRGPSAVLAGAPASCPRAAPSSSQHADQGRAERDAEGRARQADHQPDAGPQQFGAPGRRLGHRARPRYRANAATPLLTEANCSIETPAIGSKSAPSAKPPGGAPGVAVRAVSQ